MISLLAAAVSAFAPPALIGGLLAAARRGAKGAKGPRPLIAALLAGAAAAVPLYVLSARGQFLVAARLPLDSAAVAAAFLHSAALFLPEHRRRFDQARSAGAVFFAGAVSMSSMVSFLALLGEQGLTSVGVVNTELLVNVAAVAAGGCLSACLAAVASRVAPEGDKRLLRACLLAASAAIVVPLCGEILLGLMRLKAVEVAAGALTLVAKAKQLSAVVPYAVFALAAGLTALFYRRSGAPAEADLRLMPSAGRRLAASLAQNEARWIRGSAALLGVLLSVMLFQDLYASRPAAITRPVRLTPDARGEIRVRIADIADGYLHRFSYVTDDGHVVRFLLIKLDSPSGRVKIGVVYDACVMCGDKGYIQRKHEVICLACNVRIFNPSIGKEGGCNPVPLEHSIEGTEVVVRAETLAKGAKHFSQVVSIRVKDPVTGRELDSQKAPFRHEYEGANYFFESESSQARFLAQPARFAAKSRP